MPEFSGGCLCGQVRYTIRGEPLNVSICHCTHCQKNTGSAFSVNAVFPENAVDIAGRLAAFRDRGDSGHPVVRYFCPDCGTPIRSTALQTSGYFVLKAGTLDEPGLIAPTDEIYCMSAVTNWSLPRRRHETLP